MLHLLRLLLIVICFSKESICFKINLLFCLIEYHKMLFDNARNNKMFRTRTNKVALFLFIINVNNGD